MPLERCGPAPERGGDVLLAAADVAAAGGGGCGAAAGGLTRAAALGELGFLVEPPRGLAGRLLEAVRVCSSILDFRLKYSCC